MYIVIQGKISAGNQFVGIHRFIGGIVFNITIIIFYAHALVVFEERVVAVEDNVHSVSDNELDVEISAVNEIAAGELVCAALGECYLEDIAEILGGIKA